MIDEVIEVFLASMAILNNLTFRLVTYFYIFFL